MSKKPRVYNRRFPDTIPSGAVYVGRPTKWGNPYEIGKHGDRSTVIKKYERYITERIRNAKKDSDALNLEELKGKDLVCWCAPLACHADILLKLANEESGR